MQYAVEVGRCRICRYRYDSFNSDPKYLPKATSTDKLMAYWAQT